MTNQPRPTRSTPVEEYSRTMSCDGVSVRMRCYRILGGKASRFELLLDAAGQRAVVDLPEAGPHQIERALKEAAASFASSVARRLDKDGRL